MNQLVVAVAIIMLPGIISAVIADKLTSHSKWTSFKFGLYAFVLGVFTYGMLQFFQYFVDAFSSHAPSWTTLRVWEIIQNDKAAIPGGEVVLASFLAIPVAFMASGFIHYKVFNKLAQALNVTVKYGDENLYSYYLNAKEIDWVYVRDISSGLTYQGRVVSFSETDSMQELVLSEVTVYRYEDSAELYSVPTIYLSKPSGSFIIEAIPDNLLGVRDGQETVN